jgi:hypothetical protein
VTISSGASANELLVRTAVGVYGFDMQTGMLCSVRDLRGVERLSRPLGFNFWRAPTDNDHGGVEFMGRWSWVLPVGIGIGVRVLPHIPFWVMAAIDWVGDQFKMPPIGTNVSYRTIWEKGGWDKLRSRADGARVEHAHDGSIIVRASSIMHDPSSGGERVACELSTHVSASGHAWLCASCDVRTALPSIPRVGFSLGLRKAFGAACTWFGRGPHENYDDRKEGARIGVHTLPADAMHTPYIVPSENGLRCDVHWLSMRDEVPPAPCGAGASALRCWCLCVHCAGACALQWRARPPARDWRSPGSGQCDSARSRRSHAHGCMTMPVHAPSPSRAHMPPSCTLGRSSLRACSLRIALHVMQAGDGVLFSASPLMKIAVSPFSPEQLRVRSEHAHALPLPPLLLLLPLNVRCAL